MIYLTIFFTAVMAFLIPLNAVNMQRARELDDRKTARLALSAVIVCTIALLLNVNILVRDYREKHPLKETKEFTGSFTYGSDSCYMYWPKPLDQNTQE